MVQSNFFFIHDMASKIIKSLQIWYTHLHSKCLELHCLSSRLSNFWPLGGHKHSGRGTQQSSTSPESFLSFFLHVFRYELETCYIHPVGGTTHQVCASSQSGLCLWRAFQTFFLNVLMYKLESWFIHSVGCTTYWVHVSPEWGPCDLLLRLA